MILGTVVIRGPNSSIAPAALAELHLGIEFYKNGAKYAGWAKRAYVSAILMSYIFFVTNSQDAGDTLSDPGKSVKHLFCKSCWSSFANHWRANCSAVTVISRSHEG